MVDISAKVPIEMALGSPFSLLFFAQIGLRNPLRIQTAEIGMLSTWVS